MRINPLSLAIHCMVGLTIGGSSQAEDRLPHDSERSEKLDAVVVTASPLKQSAEELTRPVSVLAGTELDDRRGATLGDTVASLPGVRSSGFGPGVGRPVIRGMDGARVQTLSSGMSSLDVSTVSADHAVSIEPFLAEQIEVLKGPATLLYGSGAIGGAVNVVDGRIAEFPLPGGQPLSGRFELRGDSAADQRNAMFKLQGGNDRFVLSADALHRETGDVEIPGFAESNALLAEEGEVPDPDQRGTLPNSATRTSAGGLGLSWFGERGFVGASVSGFDSLYGIPGHAHEHGHEDKSGEDDEEAVRIDMEQRRFELKSGLLQPFAGHDSLSLKLARSLYEHVELEGSEVGTRFENQGTEARLEAVHAETNGWRGAWGVQLGRRDFNAIGAEAFVPPSMTRDLGLFLLEQRSLGQAMGLELGLRIDDVKVDPEGQAEARFTSLSGSASLRWDLDDALHLSAGLDHAERAPTAEELFSNGPHIATRSFEVGDSELDTEVANRLELGAHWHREDWRVKAALYTTQFDRFIYLADTGLEQDELPVRRWQQDDAQFNGFELEIARHLGEWQSGRWDIELTADSVRARLDRGDNLPRIPAARVTAQLNWEKDGWRARLGLARHAAQNRVASFERPSEGYTLIDAHFAYHFDHNRVGWELFVDGNNLSDREARPHTSFLKDFAPLAGRNIQFGVRAFF